MCVDFFCAWLLQWSKSLRMDIIRYRYFKFIKSYFIFLLFHTFHFFILMMGLLNLAKEEDADSLNHRKSESQHLCIQ